MIGLSRIFQRQQSGHLMVQGLIAVYGREKQKGIIAGDNTKQYVFCAVDIVERATGTIEVGQRVSFSEETDGTRNRAKHIVILKKTATSASDIERYDAPSSMRLYAEHHPSGYDILETVTEELRGENRDPDIARQLLIEEAKHCNANAVIGYYRRDRIKKIGTHKYPSYQAYGRPAILGKPNPEGAFTKAHLTQHFDAVKAREMSRAIVDADDMEHMFDITVILVALAVIVALFTVGT